MNTQPLARVCAQTPAIAQIRVAPEDFQVEEILGFEPDGQGEHLLVQIEKRNLTTPQAATDLARLVGVARRRVSWCGMKDRNAVTRQWLSVHMPGAEFPLHLASPVQVHDSLRVLRAAFHQHKLRPGYHAANVFCLHLRGITADRVELDAALQRVATQGVPNYFGEQRFGNRSINLDTRVQRRGRQAQGMHFSALRAQLFNACLDQRVAAGSWRTVLPGDALQFADGNSFFLASGHDAQDQQRVDRGELHVTGPLYGAGDGLAQDRVAELEARIFAAYPEACATLDATGMRPARRALRLVPGEFDWQWQADDVVRLGFRLRSGAFATSVLREIFEVHDARGVQAA